MSSETYFDNGDRVKFSKGWWRRHKHEKSLMKLRGTVVDCHDTSRECCYYLVEWEATKTELSAINLLPDEYHQSDALTKARKTRSQSK